VIPVGKTAQDSEKVLDERAFSIDNASQRVMR